MADQAAQNFGNHTRKVPVFVAGMLVLAVELGRRLYVLRYGLSFRSVMDVLVVAMLIALFVFMRTSVLSVQNRLIRLEMRLRLQRLLPADLASRVNDYTVGQLIAMRFAADDELAGLARKVLDEKLTNGKAIKQLVKDWQADHLRA